MCELNSFEYKNKYQSYYNFLFGNLRNKIKTIQLELGYYYDFQNGKW